MTEHTLVDLQDVIKGDVVVAKMIDKSVVELVFVCLDLMCLLSFTMLTARDLH